MSPGRKARSEILASSGVASALHADATFSTRDVVTSSDIDQRAQTSMNDPSTRSLRGSKTYDISLCHLPQSVASIPRAPYPTLSVTGDGATYSRKCPKCDHCTEARNVGVQTQCDVSPRHRNLCDHHSTGSILEETAMKPQQTSSELPRSQPLGPLFANEAAEINAERTECERKGSDVFSAKPPKNDALVGDNVTTDQAGSLLHLRPNPSQKPCDTKEWGMATPLCSAQPTQDQNYMLEHTTHKLVENSLPERSLITDAVGLCQTTSNVRTLISNTLHSSSYVALACSSTSSLSGEYNAITEARTKSQVSSIDATVANPDVNGVTSFHSQLPVIYSVPVMQNGCEEVTHSCFWPPLESAPASSLSRRFQQDTGSERPDSLPARWESKPRKNFECPISRSSIREDTQGLSTGANPLSCSAQADGTLSTSSGSATRKERSPHDRSSSVSPEPARIKSQVRDRSKSLCLDVERQPYVRNWKRGRYSLDSRMPSPHFLPRCLHPLKRRFGEVITWFSKIAQSRSDAQRLMTSQRRSAFDTIPLDEAHIRSPPVSSPCTAAILEKSSSPSQKYHAHADGKTRPHREPLTDSVAPISLAPECQPFSDSAGTAGTRSVDSKTDALLSQKGPETEALNSARRTIIGNTRNPPASTETSQNDGIPGMSHPSHCHASACSATAKRDRQRRGAHRRSAAQTSASTVMNTAERLTIFSPTAPVAFGMRHDILSYRVAVVQQSSPGSRNGNKGGSPGANAEHLDPLEGGKNVKEKQKPPPEAPNREGAENRDDANAEENNPESGRTKVHLIVGCLAVAVLVFLFLLYMLLSYNIDVIFDTEETISAPSPSPPKTELPKPGENTTYCDSDFCTLEASYLKSLLSKHKGPCDNFYDYVCDKWVSNHPVKGSGTGDVVSTDTLMQDLILKRLGELLGRQDTQADVARALYMACLDRDKANSALEEVRAFYKEWEIGEWPREKKAEVSDVWIFAGQLVRDMDLDALVKVTAVPNPRGPPATTAELNKPRFIFSCNDASRQSVTRIFRMALREVDPDISQRTDLLDEVMTVFTRLGSAPLLPAVPDTDRSAAYVSRLHNLDPGYRLFLDVVLRVNATYFDDVDATVVVRSSDYVRHYVSTAMRELPPRASLNYLGFLVLVQLAPFLPEKFRSLRQLFTKNTLGRTLDDAPGSPSLCAVAVDRVLPACIASLLSNEHSRTAVVMGYLRQLEDIYRYNLGYVSWVDNVRAVLARYQLKRRPVLKFGFFGNDCAPSGARKRATPVAFYRDVASRQQARQLQPDDDGVRRASELSTWPSFDWPQEAVYVQPTLFNDSWLTGSAWKLHASRYSVRLYRALSQLLLFRADPDERDAGEWRRSRGRALESLLGCFEWDLRQLPAELRASAAAPDSDASRGAALQQTVALQMAFRAFQKLLSNESQQQGDIRYKDLPELSSAQLFFIYYALDNCESGDVVYGEQLGHRLPAPYRVNVALRHVLEFWDAFQCPADSAMVRLPLAGTCSVVRPDAWHRGLESVDDEYYQDW